MLEPEQISIAVVRTVAQVRPRRLTGLQVIEACPSHKSASVYSSLSVLSRDNKGPLDRRRSDSGVLDYGIPAGFDVDVWIKARKVQPALTAAKPEVGGEPAPAGARIVSPADQADILTILRATERKMTGQEIYDAGDFLDRRTMFLQIGAMSDPGGLLERVKVGDTFYYQERGTIIVDTPQEALAVSQTILRARTADQVRAIDRIQDLSKAGGSKGAATPQIGPWRGDKSGRPEQTDTAEPQSVKAGGTPHTANQGLTPGETGDDIQQTSEAQAGVTVRNTGDLPGLPGSRATPVVSASVRKTDSVNSIPVQKAESVNHVDDVNQPRVLVGQTEHGDRVEVELPAHDIPVFVTRRPMERKSASIYTAPVSHDAYGLATDLVMIAAANLAAVVRELIEDASIPEELARALANFDRADQARERAKR